MKRSTYSLRYVTRMIFVSEQEERRRRRRRRKRKKKRVTMEKSRYIKNDFVSILFSILLFVRNYLILSFS